MARLALSSEPILVLKFLVTFTLLSVTSAGPTTQRNSPKCVSFCTEGNNFRYEPGTTYVYEYTSDISTSALQDVHQKSNVRLKATAEVEAVSSCELKLQLKNVEFEDLTNPQEGGEDISFRDQKSELEQFPMLFAFQDGKIEELCANQNDNVWVVNVKRGIVSMLQNSMDDLSTSGFVHETDINGGCPTEYILEGNSWGGGRSYKKIKDLTKCTSRQSQLSAVQSIPYSSASPIQSIPLLTGKLECTQVVRNQRIEKVVCEEEQLFQPFEDQSSGATTKVVQGLDFSSERKTQRQSNSEGNAVYVKKNLLFESLDESDGTGKGEDNSKDILQLIEYLETASFPKVTSNAPQLFSTFVRRLRESSESSIKHVYETVHGSTKEKYLVEALPLIGTASSLAFLREMTVTGQFPEEQAQSWLSSLAFIKYPTIEMIQAVAPIILRNESSMEGLLGISALINSYCKRHQSCNEEVVVNEILENLTSYLGSSCHVDATNTEDVRQMVLRLKAIGNTGVLPITQEVSKTPVVLKCLEDKSNTAEIRLAAVDSLRRLSCSSYDEDRIIQLFTNFEENTEIRIKTFLTMMKCANRQIVDMVKSVLYTEPVNQVASFVWTYLTNLQETNRPEKQEIRRVISNEFLKNKFSTDARKFSRNYEASTYWEDWNVGGGLDTNIVFTEESFLPKSGMFNLTVQLFGESVNLLEFGVRAHGLEQVLEKVFGPQGYFPDNRVTEFLESTRVKRDVSSQQQDTDGLGYLYGQAKPDIEQVPGGSFYTRMFGHEVLYKNFDISDKTSIPSIVDDSGKSYFNIRNILNNLSTGKSSEFSRSMILLDTSYSVATSSGFPLSLGVHAAATMSMVAKGKVSVAKLMESKELDVHGALKPSTMVNIDGTLGIKIGRGRNQFKTGLKLHNTLRSSTAVEMNLVVKGKNLLHASVNFPQDKHEIIDVSSQLFVIGPRGQIPIDDQDRDESNELMHLSNGCSSDYASEIFGMKLCMEMNIPSKISLTPKRPTFLRVYLEKVDDFTGYTIDYQFSSDPTTTKLNAVFDTPNSVINRRIAGDFLLDRGLGKLAASLESVSTAIRAEAVYTQFQKNLELSLSSNERTSFLFSAGVRNDGNVVKPHVLITWHSRPVMDLKGTIDMTPQANNDERMTIEMNLKHLTESPVKIVGQITGSGETNEASFSIESYILTGTVRSQFKKKLGYWSTKTSVDYSWKRGKLHTADLSAKLQRTKKGTLSKYLATAGMSTSQFPNNTLDFHWETQASSGFCENSLRMGWGKTAWEGHTLYSRQNQFDHSELRLECSLNSAKFNIDYRMEFAHHYNTEGFKTKVLSRVGTGNELNANIEYMSSIDDLLNKTLEAGATWPSTEYSFKALFYEKQRGTFETEVLVNLNNTRELKATAQYLNKSNNLKLDHAIEFRARGFTSVPFSGSIGLSATEKQTHVGCQVQFEGRKPYNSRMSTSLDYSHTRNSHRFEGKVTLNEKKYNGEIFYVTSKAGSKNITIDLNLENHIFVEASLSGMLPEPMVASFLVIPDKDNEPHNKLKVDGNVDANSLTLGVHYFGEEAGIAGRYDDESVLFEAVWPEEKKLMVSAVLPKFSAREAQIELEILTPFTGFNNVTFIAEHKFDGENLKSSAAGGVEDSLADFNLSGMFSSRGISLSTDLKVTDYPKYEGKIAIVRKSTRKSLKALFMSGEKKSLLEFDFIGLDDGYEGRFNFNGCPLLHKVAMEMRHEFSGPSSTYNGKIEWAVTPEESPRQLSLLSKIQLDPLNVEAIFTSPWDHVKLVTTSFTWNPYTSNRQLSWASKQNAETVNSNFKLVSSGSMKDFLHELDGEWYGKTMRLTVSGGLDGFIDSNFHSLLHLPENRFAFDFLSKREPKKYIGEFRTDLDNAVTTAGVKWDFSSEVISNKVASIWGEIPKFPPVAAILEYENVENTKIVKIKLNRKENSVVDMETTLQISGLRFWHVSSVLKSELQFLPSISLNSKHNLSDLKKISHVTTLDTFAKDENTTLLNLWQVPTSRVSANVTVDDLQDIKGTVIVGEVDCVLEGKLEAVEGGYDTKIKISSNQFHEVNFEGSFLNQDDTISSTGKLSNRNGDTILKLDVGIKQAETEKSGQFALESSITPVIKAFAGINTGDNFNVTTYLTSDAKNLLTFTAQSVISANSGNGQIRLSSDRFASIQDIRLDLDCTLGKSGVSCNSAFKDNENTHAVSLESVWNEDRKTANVMYTGIHSYSVEAQLDGLSHLVAGATYENKKVGEISVSYRPEQGDFSYGKHGVYMAYTDSEGTTQNCNVVVGLDSKKVFLNVQTPFENWSDVVIDGQLITSSIGKGLKFLLQREAESIQGSFEAKNSRKTGTLQLQSELSVVGFSKLRQMLLETAQASDIRGLSAIHPQKFTFHLVWATSNFNVKVDTPVDFLKRLAFSGNWELKQPQKFISVTGQVNDKEYNLRADFQGESDRFSGKLSLNGDDLCKLEADYDFTNEYDANVLLEIPSKQWDIGCKFSIKQNSLQVELKTPIKNYETVSLSLLRETPSLSEGLYSVAWNVNGKADKIELKYEFGQGNIELRALTPFQPWDSVVVTILYDTPFQKLSFHTQRGDGEEVKVKFEMECSGNMSNFQTPASSSILIAIESPIKNFENIKFSLLYDRKDLVHVGNLSIIRNEGETEGKLNLKFQHSDPVSLDISAHLASPSLTSKATAHASLLVDPSGESTISAHVQANGKRYEMYGLSQMTSSVTKFEMRTSLPFLRQLKFALKKGTSVTLHGIWTGNSKQVEVHGDLLCSGWSSTRVGFNVTTSVSLIGSFGFDGEIRSDEGSTVAKLVFQNHKVRWSAKLNRHQTGDGSDDWRLQVNTPLVGYKHVVVSLKHLFASPERNVTASIQLNKKEMSMRMTHKAHQLNMMLFSELSYLPLQAQISSDWETDLILKIETNAGNHEYGTSFNLDLNGASHGNLDFAISSMSNLDTSLDWDFNGDVRQGQGLVNVKNSLIGKRSVRSSWKNENWKEFQGDLWVKTGGEEGLEKGATVQYKVEPHLHYGSIHASVNYTLSEGSKSIIFEGSVDETSSHLAFDSALKTPFKDFQTFQAKGYLTMKNDIIFNIDASLNEEKLIAGDLNLAVMPLKSRFMLDLDVPLVTEPIELDAGYDIVTESKTVSIMFKQNVYVINVQLVVTVPQNSHLVDLNLKAESTVPNMFLDVSGKARVEYAVGEDGTRQFSFSLTGSDVGDWKLLASMRAVSDLYAKVIFEGPYSMLPSLMAELNFAGNMRQGVRSDLTVIVQDSEFTANFNVDSSLWETGYKLTSGGLSSIGEAKVSYESDQTNLDIRYIGSGDINYRIVGNMKITQETKQGSGTITISSGTETEVPLSFDISVENQGNIRAVGSSYEKEAKLNIHLEGTNGGSWVTEGKTHIKLEGNLFGSGELDMSVNAQHIFRDGKYSVNVTSSEKFALETYLKTGQTAALLVRGKWLSSEYAAILDVKLAPSNVFAHASIPSWPLNVELTGEYGSAQDSSFVNGVFTFNQHRSLLNSSMVRNGNHSVCTATLEIPSIKQKFDIEITATFLAHQNMKGTVRLIANDQEFLVAGSLKTQIFESSEGERYIERMVQISSNITTVERTSIGFELFLRKPVRTYSSVSAIGTLTINDKVSTLSGGYEIPSPDSLNTGLYLKLQSSYLPPEENYEFFLKSFDNRMRKVEGKLNYKITRFDILWDLLMPTSVISFSYTGRSDDGEKLFLQVESVFNPSENIQLNINSQGWDTHYTFRTSLTRSATTVVGYLFMDAPRLLTAANEYKITVMANDDGSYTMEASAVRGRLIMELVGDTAISTHSINVVLKAMGSYGSHYVMIVGGREDDGEYGFDMTAESSSLLVGKRVNIRGNVTVDGKSVTTTLQCRARRNVHEVSVMLRREDKGTNKISINVDSPSFDPVNLDAEWTSQENKNYYGKLFIQGFGKVHQSEFALNLINFEGKLHIISPLLPSNEFNFHLKSVVNSENIDILGDIRIRGSHWRMEGVASFGGVQDMSFKLETRTPFQFLDRVTFGIKSTKDEIYLEVYTPATYIPNVLFKLGGMRGLRRGLWYELKPNVVVSLPNGKYSAIASLELPKYETKGVLHILLGHTGTGTQSQTVEAFVELSPLNAFKLQMEDPGHLQLKLVTPFSFLEQAKLNIEGEINSKRSGKLQIAAELNSHKGRFDGSFDNTNGNMQAVTRLLTNIVGYEKSAFAFAIQTFQGIGNGKSFHVEFMKPDWENQFRLDADYRYIFESFAELEGEVNINMDSYMNVPPFHSRIKSSFKEGRYNGVLEGEFGLHRPSLKVETEKLQEKFTVFIEGKAGERDRYNVVNTLELIPLHGEYSFRERMHWNGSEVLNLEMALLDEEELFEGHLHMFTPWGPLNSKAILTPITFITLNEALTLSQLIKNSNVTVDVHFNNTKIVGLEVVSRDGMRLFEIHNPVRPVSLSVAVEKVEWNALRVKAGVCWDLYVPEKSSIGLDAYLYRRSTGLTVGGYLALAKYGIVTVNFEHFLISSKLAQKLAIRWNGFAGRSGNVGYNLNVTDKSTGFNRRQIDYALKLIAPSRTILIGGESSTAEDKYATHNVAISWDAFRNPEKFLKFNVTSKKSTTWRTMHISRSLQIQHVSWEEPLSFSMERMFVHDTLKQIELQVRPSSNPNSHLTVLAVWEDGDWSSLTSSVRQPFSNVNALVKYNITEESKSVLLNYMLFTGETKMISANFLRTSDSQQALLQSGDATNLRTVCSFNSVSTLGEHSIKANLLSYQLTSNIQRQLPYADITLRHDNSHKVQLFVGLPHPREIVLKTARSHFTKTMNDVNVLVRLNSSNLLSARVHWRPELMDDIVNYDWLRGSKHFMQSVFPSFQELSGAIRVEAEGHWSLFSVPVQNALVAFYEFSATEVNQIFKELQVISKGAQELYANNAFFIKDVVEAVYAGFAPLPKLLQKMYELAKEVCTTTCGYLANIGKRVYNIVVKYYGKLELHVMKAWDDVENLLTKFWTRHSAWLQKLSEELEEFIDALIEAFEGRIEMLEEKLLAVGFVRKLIRLYQDYSAWLDELPLDDYMSAIEDFFQIKVWDKLEDIFGPYLEVIRNALDADYLKELLETPPIPYIRFVLRQTKHALVRLWDVVEIEGKVKDLVRHTLKNLDGLMQRNFPSWELDWDLDRGVIEYDQSLSFIEWQDFTQYPRWHLQSQETQEVNQITNFYYQVMDYIEHLKPIFDMRIRDILPPFGGFAMMAGDHHYYTFDKKYYRFAGDCSYVLVADLLHNGFSFIVNYDSSRDGDITKRSYSVVIPNNNIEFDAADFKVTVNNRKVELPMKIDTVYIRRHETRLDIYDVRGYQITCSLSPSVCTFSTSGWYYGKLAGLLGTYDNERVNDFRSADGQIISDIASFTYSWRVGRDRNQCRMKNFAKEEVYLTNVDDICHNLLAKRTSPLRPCFNTVDTAVFMDMCKYDVSRNVNSATRPESACTSMSAYVTECQKSNVDVWMPPTCVRCKLSDGSALTTGENVTLQTNGNQPPPFSSDIVILVEEQSCMDQVDISSTVAKLEAALRADGISDNRYAYVGFGGRGIHFEPHIQTSSSSVWSHSTLFKVLDKANVTGVRGADLYSAIQFATTMNFRAGVSKTLIALTCGSSRCGDSSRYAETLTLLVENDFMLHMLTPVPFSFKGDKKQDNTLKVYGFDANGAYTTHHAKRGPLVADASIKRQLNLPKDLCTPLAVETNGTRFTTENFTKKMLDVWSRRVAQTAKPSECQRCECVPEKNGGSRFMCHQCVSPTMWKFMEEWKSYQSQEVDDVFGVDMIETEAFILPPH